MQTELCKQLRQQNWKKKIQKIKSMINNYFGQVKNYVGQAKFKNSIIMLLVANDRPWQMGTHQIYSKITLNSNVNVKSIIDPDNMQFLQELLSIKH